MAIEVMTLDELIAGIYNLPNFPIDKPEDLEKFKETVNLYRSMQESDGIEKAVLIVTRSLTKVIWGEITEYITDNRSALEAGWRTVDGFDDKVDAHPEDHCKRCGRRMRLNYAADSEVWNKVVGDLWSIICVDCFIELCQGRGIEPEFVVFHIPGSEYYVNIFELHTELAIRQEKDRAKLEKFPTPLARLVTLLQVSIALIVLGVILLGVIGSFIVLHVGIFMGSLTALYGLGLWLFKLVKKDDWKKLDVGVHKDNNEEDCVDEEDA